MGYHGKLAEYRVTLVFYLVLFVALGGNVYGTSALFVDTDKESGIPEVSLAPDGVFDKELLKEDLLLLLLLCLLEGVEVGK